MKARGLFGQLCDSFRLRDDSLVALMDYEFYGDAGGNRDLSNVAVGGYISTVARWKAFQRPWQDALRDENVECFHRSQMEPPFHGEFRDWTVKHQIPVLKRLHKLIRLHTIRGVGYAVRNKSFTQLVPSKIQKQYGGPYGWAVLLEVVEVGLWARRRGGWVTYFFEAGDDGEKQASGTMKELYDSSRYRELFRINGWGFYPKKDNPVTGQRGIVQLQPADFIAYEAYKDIDNYIAGSPRAARKSRKDLIRPQEDELRFWQDKPFAMWLARFAELNGDAIKTLITTNPFT